MKELILVRHAKSSWDNPSLKDFDRPLNERGKKDVITMSERLASRNVHPDLLIASPARRTLTTAKAFAKTLEIKAEEIVLVPSLYQALPAEFFRVIKNIDNSKNCVLMFTHNTGLTDFANELTNVHIDNIPTCGIFAVKADIANWRDFAKSNKQFWFFDYPKLLL
ncbi:MAG: phosphohistidine phosphatase [Pseudopedobacter saltans]|uniref:Phosphohistidine phosphatase n=1 Tax=Pseudopedobacter saltans TaxID=151895 RepID=A0A2W5F780_9SPHI|nr:MAG: phosphohistidine phosphatase [Pseudopedobacter saltans]